MKKHRAIFILFLSLIVLPTCLLAVIGFAASRTVSCQACQEENRKVLNVSFSELRLSPKKYTNQIIRVEAIFNHDAGYTFLQDPSNHDRKDSLPLGFGKDFITCDATQKALTFHTGFETWYDGASHVTVIGKYGIVDDQRDFQTGQTGFTLLCLEQVQSANTIKEISINTIRYSIGQIGKRIFHPLRNT